MCGGYTCREEIKVFGNISIPTFVWGQYQACKYGTKCWTTSLTIPFMHWSKNDPTIALAPQVKIPPKFLTVQKCKQYVIYFYLPKQFNKSPSCTGLVQKAEQHFSENILVVIDEEKKQSCLFSTDSVTFDGHVSCAVVGDDLFIVHGDKMAQVEKFTYLLVASASIDHNTTFSISFDLTVPHANSTLFAIQDTLCIVVVVMINMSHSLRYTSLIS